MAVIVNVSLFINLKAPSFDRSWNSKKYISILTSRLEARIGKVIRFRFGFTNPKLRLLEVLLLLLLGFGTFRHQD